MNVYENQQCYFRSAISNKVIYRHTPRDSKILFINILKTLKNWLHGECFRHFSEYEYLFTHNSEGYCQIIFISV